MDGGDLFSSANTVYKQEVRCYRVEELRRRGLGGSGHDERRRSVGASGPKPGNEVQLECEMHITTDYKMTPGPDKRYKGMFLQDPRYPFTVETLYWDKGGNVGAAVRGDRRFQQMFRICAASYISLTRTTESGNWQDIGEQVTRGEAASDL